MGGGRFPIGGIIHHRKEVSNMREVDTKTGVNILLAGALVATAIIAYQALEVVNIFVGIQ